MIDKKTGYYSLSDMLSYDPWKYFYIGTYFKWSLLLISLMLLVYFILTNNDWDFFI